jgi:hypothetical protein
LRLLFHGDLSLHVVFRHPERWPLSSWLYWQTRAPKEGDRRCHSRCVNVHWQRWQYTWSDDARVAVERIDQECHVSFRQPDIVPHLSLLFPPQ